MRNLAIKLTHISKRYILYHEKPTLMENIFKRGKQEEFWSLKNVSLNIQTGEQVGIIGANGSGKTTLLKIINQITKPTEGRVKTFGKIVSLVGLEAGFHPELTGEENIYLNAMLLGMNKRETQEKLAQIVKFADIGKFLDAPFFTYSEGMKLRLGFSIAIHTDPDILIIDEVLSVGDEDFQLKSFTKIKELFEQGKTVIIVSHDLESLRTYTQRIVWLEDGRIKKDGQVKGIIDLYKKSF